LNGVCRNARVSSRRTGLIRLDLGEVRKHGCGAIVTTETGEVGEISRVVHHRRRHHVAGADIQALFTRGTQIFGKALGFLAGDVAIPVAAAILVVVLDVRRQRRGLGDLEVRVGIVVAIEARGEVVTQADGMSHLVQRHGFEECLLHAQRSFVQTHTVERFGVIAVVLRVEQRVVLDVHVARGHRQLALLLELQLALRGVDGCRAGSLSAHFVVVRKCLCELRIERAAFEPELAVREDLRAALSAFELFQLRLQALHARA
jgi:hypothetical protein